MMQHGCYGVMIFHLGSQTLVFVMDPQVFSMVKYSSLISSRFNTPYAVFVEWKLSAQTYYERANVEIICVVEAIDPIQRDVPRRPELHDDDIPFDSEFAPCVLASGCAKKRGGWLANRGAAGCSLKVDLDSCHHTITLNRWDRRRS